jgi:phospho-N-acetylmuramoyl-pentapeptide-transferase
MLYKLLYPLSKSIPAFNVFRYITFRAAMAAVTALLLALALGPSMIRLLIRRQIGQSIRESGPASHHAKAGVPTMGGVLILLAVILATFLWMDLSNRFVWIALATLLAFGAVGFADDFIKFAKRRSLGLTGRGKLVPQFVVAFALAFAIDHWAAPGSLSAILTFPFLKRFLLDLGFLYVPFVALVLVGSSNAVNLTDGLDGLASGRWGRGRDCHPLYVTGSGGGPVPADPPSAGGELAVFCGPSWARRSASSGSTATPPTSSWATSERFLGGAIAAVAVMTKQEMLLAIVGGVFVVEAFSVIVQVVSFKTRGRRVFRMAPLHHHFELAGWPESRVVIRFWILAIFFAVLGLSTLKLR